MDQTTRPRRSRGSPAVAAGAIAALQLGVLTMLWTTVLDVPPEAPLGPVWFVVVNWLATAILVAGVVVRALSIRLPRAVVLAATAAVIAVMVWLVVVVSTSEAGSLLFLFLIVWVVALAAGLLYAAVDRSPASADWLRPR